MQQVERIGKISELIDSLPEHWTLSTIKDLLPIVVPNENHNHNHPSPGDLACSVITSQSNTSKHIAREYNICLNRVPLFPHMLELVGNTAIHPRKKRRVLARMVSLSIYSFALAPYFCSGLTAGWLSFVIPAILKQRVTSLAQDLK
eukprot:6415208-Amphidinium_carterae.1